MKYLQATPPTRAHPQTLSSITSLGHPLRQAHTRKTLNGGSRKEDERTGGSPSSI